MDALINAAARALALGDPFAALNRVALRDDAPALALRGIAMAQLGDLARARELLRAAARAFGPREAVARARCQVAEAEIAFADRELGWPVARLEAALATLEAHGDQLNAAHARLLAARRLLLLGQPEAADAQLERLQPATLAPPLRAIQRLTAAGIALRQLRARAARAALQEAAAAAREAGIAALQAEVEAAQQVLDAPAARCIAHGEERLLRLEEIEPLLQREALLVDACRYRVGTPRVRVPRASRPVLFALARTLAEAWPADASRAQLIAGAFRTRHFDETHRARLRVEIGRLRTALDGLAGIQATRAGFILTPLRVDEVLVLARPLEDRHATVLACLADGRAWSSSALALALGSSQRQVQRALEALAADGRVQAFGRGRARRWLSPPPGFATTLLLPAPVSG